MEEGGEGWEEEGSSSPSRLAHATHVDVPSLEERVLEVERVVKMVLEGLARKGR